MRRNCNLELCLFPSNSGHHPKVEESSSKSPTMQNYFHQEQQQQQPLTIFYEGKICVADVTQIQAKSILMLANKRVEEEIRVRTPTGSSEPSTPTILQSPGTGLSMTKSLQRFLQKRKARVQEASPYHR